MWRNVWAVIRREYLQRVRSKWFVAATIGGPVLMAAIFFFPVYMGMRSDGDESRVAVVDATGVLYERIAPDLEQGGWRVERVEWTSDVLSDLERRAEEGEIAGFLVLDDVTLRTGEATFHTLRRPSPLRSMTMRSAVTYAALSYNLEESGVDAASMLRGGDLQVELLSDAESGADGPRFAIAYGGAFFLYMVILIYAVAVMRATLEEKTSRIVEVVISSMEPWHLMLGKILGVGAVSFTQMAVWLTTAVLIGGAGIPALLAAQPQLGDLARLSEVLPGVGLLALFVGFFVFGFFMYSGFYAAVGAMCSTDEEAQQAQFPLVMLLVVPILMVMPVIQSPMTPMATGLSLFPLFSPILMWTRVASASVPVWQVALSFVLMALAVLAIAWLAGRIYKVGILMTGKRPTLPELWRWVKEA
jgi:ABC-2 type transport system permease protein